MLKISPKIFPNDKILRRKIKDLSKYSRFKKKKWNLQN
jgi:hypothetical protein